MEAGRWASACWALSRGAPVLHASPPGAPGAGLGGCTGQRWGACGGRASEACPVPPGTLLRPSCDHWRALETSTTECCVWVTGCPQPLVLWSVQKRFVHSLLLSRWLAAGRDIAALRPLPGACMGETETPCPDPSPGPPKPEVATPARQPDRATPLALSSPRAGACVATWYFRNKRRQPC